MLKNLKKNYFLLISTFLIFYFFFNLMSGEGKNHPGLYRQGLLIMNNDINWVRPDLKISLNSSEKILARIRYRQPLRPGQIFRGQEGLYLIFDKKQKAISSGQFAAWYKGKELIGSGVIY